MALPVQRLNEKLEGEMEFKRKKYSVPFALPGDLVQFRILRKGRKSKFQVMHIERAEHPPEEIITSLEPGCEHAGTCGGCRARHLDYDFQWKWKSRPIAERMKQDFELEPELLPAPEKEHFRNRMDYAVDGTSIGLRPPQDFETVLPLSQCPVLRYPGEEILAKCAELIHRFPEVGWKRETLSGWLKYVTLRIGLSGVVVLTTSGETEAGKEFLTELNSWIENRNRNSEFEISVVETVTEPGQELSCTPGGHPLLGKPEYTERLAGVEFSVPYDSFFQPNPVAFTGLFQRILENTQEKLDPLLSQMSSVPVKLVDLYCGAGVLSSVLVERWPTISSVVGYEFVESAVTEASRRFANKGIQTSFQAVDLNKPEADLALNSNLIIADPPRAGISPRLCKLIAEARPAPYMLYISCNPETQLRDLDILKVSYRPVQAVLADCFPYTGHMEQAILLERIS